MFLHCCDDGISPKNYLDAMKLMFKKKSTYN